MTIFATTQSRSSAARISLIIGYLAMVAGPVTLCTCGPVFMGALASVLGLVAVLLGPARYRVLGAFPLVLGAAMSVHAYPQFQKETDGYRTRAALAEVVNLGTTIATALDSRRSAGKPLPGSIDELGVSAPQAKVASVGIKSADRFAITLALPGAAGNELVFVAETVDGTRGWKCMARGLTHLSRPTGCREDADVAIEPDRK